MRCPQAPAPRDRLDVGHVPRSLARAASDLLLEVSRNPLLGSAGFPIGCGGRAQGAPGARPQLRARSRSSWPSTATALGLHPGTELRTVSSCWRSPRPELLDQGAPRRPLGPRSILDASSRPRTVTKRAATTSPERRSALLGLCDTFRLGVQAVRLIRTAVFQLRNPSPPLPRWCVGRRRRGRQRRHPHRVLPGR